MKYGFHLSIAGKEGVAGAALEAELLGLGCFQIFAKSPKSWKPRPLSAKEVEHFRARRENLGGLPAVVHANYLINLAAEGELWQKSVFALADDLAKAQTLGIEYVVVHPGSGPVSQARKGALQALELAQVRNSPQLLIENTAGGGEKLGSKLDELALMIENTPFGICLDTCHAFAAGYALQQNPEALIKLLTHTVGLERVPVLHLNDSKAPLGSHLDQHANLMQGQMGLGLRDFALHPAWHRALLIMETPRNPQDDAHNLRVLREWLA